jgi:hypothetical protein
MQLNTQVPVFRHDIRSVLLERSLNVDANAWKAMSGMVAEVAVDEAVEEPVQGLG